MAKGKKQPDRGGFDAPRTARKDDRLERWPFSQSVYRLATDVPTEWSVRIGVFGKWGSGKTTVLRYVEEQARQDKHPVLRFNPWHYDDQDALLLAFFEALSALIHDFSRSQTDLSQTLKSWFRETVGFAHSAESLLKAAGSTGAAAHGLVTLAKGALKISSEDIKALRKRLKGKRLLVLVDDVDRAQPDIVPRVLFWIRELFDLPGVSFVVAFDVERVVAVLSHRDPRFDTTEFLEKVIDFRCRLPEPTATQLVELALQEHKECAAFISEADVRLVADALPTNPRRVRAIFRHLRALGAEVQRYGQREIDPVLLLLVETIRVQWPVFLERLRVEEDLLMNVLRGSPNNAATPKRSRTPAEEAQTTLPEQLATAENIDVERLGEILATVQRRVFAGSAGLAQHVGLLDHPPAVTNAEFDQLMSCWISAQSPDTIRRWTNHQASARSVSQPQVVDGLYVVGARRWAEGVDQASDDPTYESVISGLENVDETMMFLRDLNDVQPPSAETITEMIEALTRWAHFEGVPYAKRLDDLESYLVGVLSRGRRPHQAAATIPSGGPMPQERRLIRRLETAVGIMAAEEVIEALGTPDGIRQLRAEWPQRFWRIAVSNKDAPLWKEDRRGRMLAELEGAAPQDVVFLVRALLSDLGAPGHVLTSDTEVTQRLWKNATRIQLNRRIWGTLDEARNHIQTTLKQDDLLPTPDWVADFPTGRDPGPTP